MFFVLLDAQLPKILRAVKFDSAAAFPRGYEADFRRALLTFRHQVRATSRSNRPWRLAWLRTSVQAFLSVCCIIASQFSRASACAALACPVRTSRFEGQAHDFEEG